MIDQTFFKGHPIRLMDKDFVVSGWVLPETTHEVVKSAELRFTREDQTAGWQVEINHWISREDVLKAMKAEGAGDVGFAKYVDVSHLSSGNYRLSLAFASGGVNYTCDHHEMVALP
ncbi:hypothetical protein B0E50_07960 [Rhodanobacter sp. C01]|nr:hypothetical protein B0E50_07960 [Rhodanobacter sp. C01]